MTKKMNEENYEEFVAEMLKAEGDKIWQVVERFNDAIPEGANVLTVTHAALIMVAKGLLRLPDNKIVRTGVKYYQMQLASVVEQTLEDRRREKDGAN